MSEVIARMEMPAGCANCPMGDDDSRFCKAAKEYIPMLGRPSWCPIIGVLPDEHGDLIDRGKLLKDIEMYHVSDGCFQHWVELQDAVIAAERKDDERADKA